MRRGAGLATLVLCAVLTGCGGTPTPHALPSSTPRITVDPSTATPAQAVLPLVPAQATELTVTDFEQLPHPVDWAAADAHEPLLTRGLLRGSHHQDDVRWEAHWDGGGTSGWALLLDDGVDASSVAPAGATIDGQLLTHGAATGDSWAQDGSVASLVKDDAIATYVAKGCLPGDQVGVPAGDQTAGLQPLDGYALELTDILATARLSAGRTDLFARLRLAASLPAFAATFTGGVADPVSGRVGYQVDDPAQAARLTLGHQLPFAVCSS